MEKEQGQQHEHGSDRDVVSGIRYGHARIPKFLIFSYIAVCVWGLYYAATAQVSDDRAALAAVPSADNGRNIVQSRCAGCHSMGTDKVFGPGLQGVGSRLTADELTKILQEGKGQMPPPTSMGLTENDLKSVQLFLEANK